MDFSNNTLEYINKDLGNQYILLKRAADLIKAKKAATYPIFVFYNDGIQLGVLLYEKQMTGSNWNINLSFLEEFVEKKLIKKENVGTFKAAYNKSDDTICVFLINEEGASFIFYPQE